MKMPSKEIKKLTASQPMTNADRIRAMSDEELSEFLWFFSVREICYGGDSGCLFRPDLDKWLQQPAEEVT